MNRRYVIAVFSLLLIYLGCPVCAQSILVERDCHPAIKAAANILAKKSGISTSNIAENADGGLPKNGEIMLITGDLSQVQKPVISENVGKIKHDGYVVVSRDGGLTVYGARPRSLLYAVADYDLWKSLKSGKYLRNPDFAIRGANNDRSGGDVAGRSVEQLVSDLGINLISQTGGMDAYKFLTLKDYFPEIYEKLPKEYKKKAEKQRLELKAKGKDFFEACRRADIPAYAFFYGNDVLRWSPELTKAILEAHPELKGVRAPFSWEKASLCPSKPLSWKIMDAALKEFVDVNAFDCEGLIITYWDWYGINCQCDECKKNGLNKFSNQIYECTTNYSKTLSALGKKMILRTWSSGVPHWFGFVDETTGANGRQFVHAPGMGAFGGDTLDLWGRVVNEAPESVTLQSKAYYSDCQPNSRLNMLIGKTGKHPEMIEYQLAGQTIGHYMTPASEVNYIAKTVGEAQKLMQPEKGIFTYYGAFHQSNYSLLNDIVNGINLYAWREYSWDADADQNQIWLRWATPIYGEKAAPHIIKALQLSEDVTTKLFSPLGFGTSTESTFPEDINRKETLLMYTNRHYLPEYARFLEPTKENIELVVKEKAQMQAEIDVMKVEIENAYIDRLPSEKYKELMARCNWLQVLATVSKHIDESLWRFRYIRYLNSMRTADPEQMKYLAAAYDEVNRLAPKLFNYDKDAQFSCYDKPLADIDKQPRLGNPRPLMKELYTKSLEYTQEIVGPDYLPDEYRR